MTESIEAKVAVLENRVGNHEDLLNKQIEKNENQVELNTLLKMQIEVNKSQQDQLVKFGETMDKVNTNLTNLNSNQKQFQQELSQINSRVGKIEQTSDEFKLDPRKIVKWALVGLGSIIITVISAYVLFKFGFKSK
ncbi:hypothetical protein [Niallia taxi]|uniref:hypothetical protein n=1 Tax=Niallia taxi TaxID=2499688 RepID=UPI00300A7F10